MKPKRKQKKLRITEADFMLANRRAARMEEISEHGRPVSMRTALHKSKKVYDRKRLKRAGINSDDLSFFFWKTINYRYWPNLSLRKRTTDCLILERVFPISFWKSTSRHRKQPRNINAPQSHWMPS